MTVISVRLPEKLLHEVDSRAHDCDLPRAEYIRFAIERMNQEVKSKESRQRLMKASLRVRKENMRINAEFSKIEDDIKD